MEDEIRLCEVCHENALSKAQSRFCSKVCYRKYSTEKQILKRKLLTREKREKQTFPVWYCDNVHENKLDFDPIKEKIRFRHYKCHCGKGTKL